MRGVVSARGNVLTQIHQRLLYVCKPKNQPYTRTNHLQHTSTRIFFFFFLPVCLSRVRYVTSTICAPPGPSSHVSTDFTRIRYHRQRVTPFPFPATSTKRRRVTFSRRSSSTLLSTFSCSKRSCVLISSQREVIFSLSDSDSLRSSSSFGRELPWSSSCCLPARK